MGDAQVVLGRFEGVVSDLLALDRSVLPAGELLGLVRGFETQLRRLAAVDQANLAELESRHVAAELRVRDTKALLVDMLRIDPGEARRRVELARDLGPRTGLTGEALEPVFPVVAAAVAAGEVSVAHAGRIVAFTEKLPPHITPAVSAELQANLVEASRQTYPGTVATLAASWLARIDQDGVEPREEALQRRRALTIHTDADGWSTVTGFASPRLTAVLKTVLDSLAAPHPTEDGTPDPRTHTQRQHDGLQDALECVLRCGELPDVAAAPVTILVTITESDLRQRVGHAVTGHGDLLPVTTLLQMAGDADILPIHLTDTGGIMAYGRTKRLATPAQRRALAARDHGCSRPGCTAPPGWCQTHHITSWADGGATDITNMTLVCPRDHQLLHQGWNIHMREGIPHWRPPEWIDPQRLPRRNTAHHLPVRFSRQTERGR